MLTGRPIGRMIGTASPGRSERSAVAVFRAVALVQLTEQVNVAEVQSDPQGKQQARRDSAGFRLSGRPDCGHPSRRSRQPRRRWPATWCRSWWWLWLRRWESQASGWRAWKERLGDGSELPCLWRVTMKASISRFLVAVLTEPSQPSRDRVRSLPLARITDRAHPVLRATVGDGVDDGPEFRATAANHRRRHAVDRCRDRGVAGQQETVDRLWAGGFRGLGAEAEGRIGAEPPARTYRTNRSARKAAINLAGTDNANGSIF